MVSNAGLLNLSMMRLARINDESLNGSLKNFIALDKIKEVKSKFI